MQEFSTTPQMSDEQILASVVEQSPVKNEEQSGNKKGRHQGENTVSKSEARRAVL